MISKSQRGDRMGGLVGYLFGPGRHEEHSNQRVVAGSDPSWVGVTQPDRETLAQLVAELDDPMVRFGDRTKQGYVYHLVVSVGQVDGVLSDEQWRATAEAMADKLGFEDKVEWVAVNHGLSANGNDHIHLVANLICTDGTIAQMPYERVRLRAVCMELEARFGVTATAPAGLGQGSLSRREVAAVASGQVADVADLTRRRVATALRGVVTGVRTEAEFVERLRGEGLVVRPRMDKDNPGQVIGYSVGQRGPNPGDRTVWYGGGTLGKDLRLPALRARWGQTPEQRAEAAPVWASAKTRQQTVTAQHAVLVRQALGEVSALLGKIPAGDAATWTRVALDSAGLLAAAASSSSDDATRRTLIGAWREVHRAIPVTVVPTAAGGTHASGSPPVVRRDDAELVTAAVSDTQAWHATTLLGAAARVLMAGRLSDAAPEVRLPALIAQVAQLVAQISRTIAATEAATAAQKRAAEATARAAVAAEVAADNWLLEQDGRRVARGPDEGLRAPAAAMLGFGKTPEQMLAGAYGKRATKPGRDSQRDAAPSVTPQHQQEFGEEP